MRKFSTLCGMLSVLAMPLVSHAQKVTPDDLPRGFLNPFGFVQVLLPDSLATNAQTYQLLLLQRCHTNLSRALSEADLPSVRYWLRVSSLILNPLLTEKRR